MAENGSGSIERVSFDMAQLIWQAEKVGGSWDQGDRAKFLTLYGECLDAVRRNRPAARVPIGGV